jgi:H+/Cl- antiporter ClcA
MPSFWRNRVVFWAGALAAGAVAVVFAKLADAAYRLFERMVQADSWWPLLVTPLAFALLTKLTQGFLRDTRGSGIPQVIALLEYPNEAFRSRVLSVPMAIGKMALTLVALLAGASIGREGPSVHVGAALLYCFGRWSGITDPVIQGRLILAGAAAGLSAAFNTPLAGIVFAIEEMMGAYEHKMSGVLLTAVILAGVLSVGLVGNYAYFGTVHASLPLGTAWFAVCVMGIVGGLAGGLFSRLLLPGSHGLPRLIGSIRRRAPVLFAAVCGAILVLSSHASGDNLYGTGYEQARALLEGRPITGEWFGPLKLLANLVSGWATLPGGIFSPALAVGAGLGDAMSTILPRTDATAVVLLGVAAYLSGVTQAPLTAAIISIELTDNQGMAIPILAVCLLARGVSSLICPIPIYKALAALAVAEAQQACALAEGGPGQDPAPR